MQAKLWNTTIIMHSSAKWTNNKFSNFRTISK